MIIACPSCNTKFSVDDQHLADVENPRFHCSRCDHFFTASSEEKSEEKNDGDLEDQLPLDKPDPELTLGTIERPIEIPPPPPESMVNSPEMPAVSVSPEEKGEQLDLLDEASEEETSGKSEPQTYQRTSWGEILDEEEDNPPVTANWPAEGNQSYEVDMSSAGSRMEAFLPPRPVHEFSESLAVIDDASEITPHEAPLTATWNDAKSILRKDSGEEQSRNEFSEQTQSFGQTAWPKTEEETLNENEMYGSEYDEALEIIRPHQGSEDEADETPSEGSSLADLGISVTKNSELRAISGVTFVCAFPVLLLLGLWQWGQHIDRSPYLVKKLFHLSDSGVPAVPPDTLDVVGVVSKKITLDSGETVLEVSGEVFNADSIPFDKVNLESALYDKNNNKISSQVIALHNRMRGGTLASLSAKDITKLQKQELQNQEPIAPASKVPFRVIFTGLNGSEAWHGTRVFSVIDNPQYNS